MITEIKNCHQHHHHHNKKINRKAHFTQKKEGEYELEENW
jgi:hypothetical protein